MGKLSTSESSKPKVSQRIQIVIVAAALAGGMFMSLVAPGSKVYAVDYNAEIKKLQTENASNESTRTSLQASAATLEAKISSLQTNIAALDGLIQSNESLRTDLTGKIAANQAEITRNSEILKVSIREMYIDGDMSMMEKMASSDSLSEYVDKEQYTISAQDEIQKTLDKISSLKKQQEQQKQQVDQLLTDSRTMQSQIAAQKEELSGLLSQNQSQQAQYSQTIATNNSQITDLERQQAEENARFLREQAALAAAAKAKAAQTNTPVVQEAAPAGVSAVNGANYPWANAPWPNDLPDPWGMYQRQCVSYTAWKVSASGRHMPNWGGRGNANQWDDNARAAGIPVDSNPRVGDVAVRNRGTYGHVMYVEAVNSDGSIDISQYNANWDGRYSTARIFPGDLVFIHF